MKGLSKSRYTAFCQCPKNLWQNVSDLRCQYFASDSDIVKYTKVQGIGITYNK